MNDLPTTKTFPMEKTGGELIPHRDKYGDGTVKAMIQRSRELSEEARFALSCIEKWGLVSATDDGEDSCGRHQLRLTDTDEVVNRAFELAEKAFERIEEKKMYDELPSYAELEEAARENAQRN